MNRLLPLLCCLLLVGCDLLKDALDTPAGGLAPQVTSSDLALRRSPGLRALAAWYCPQVIDDPIVRLTCQVTLGPPPPQDALAFEFGLTLTVRNPNEVPVPALDVLLALTLFQGQDTEGLGAICVSLCQADEAQCDGRPKAGACTAEQRDIRTLDDFAARIPDLIGLAQSGASGSLEQQLRRSLLAARGDIQLDLTFALGIDQALRVLRKAATRSVQDLLGGASAVLEIPVSAEGTVFVKLPTVGRLGVGYGPLRTSWRIL